MRNHKLINNILGWITFLIAFTVYLMTMEPTASFWDCGEFISSAFKLEIGHAPGAPFFMLTANLFSQFASDVSQVPLMVNTMSALASALTIMFLFWSITHLARKIILTNGEKATTAQSILIFGCGLIGALVYTFSDTFWFSAVEAEVYAYSSLFTAVVFWLILKWEDVADQPHADRWIIVIAYLMGLSIGVHLLNLLCIPAIVLVYYYKKYPNPTMKGTIYALLISFAIIALMMFGIVQGLVEVCGWFELLCVNVLGMPYNSGVFFFILLIGGVLAWAIWETMREKVNETRMKIAFILAITLLGIPFISDGYVIGILLIAALTAFLFIKKNVGIRALNTILVCLMVIVVGYSSYALIMIRATADTPMNQSNPNNVFSLRSYLAREQYGEKPLFYGNTYVSEIKRKAEGDVCSPIVKDGAPIWTRVIKKDKNEKDRYYISGYEKNIEYMDELEMFLPRMHSKNARHIEAYKEWGNVKGIPININRCGENITVIKPTFAENIRFFFTYQLNFMYWRYFMWNFSGRQNDIQGQGEITNGNWITGIKFIDEVLVGPQDDMPDDIAKNKGHNVYFMLPFLLGILGLLYQAYAGKKGIQSFWITFFLFFMTGIAIVLYLNQEPFQVRERDYAYAGSFYAFCIWVGFGVAAIAKALEKYLKASPTIAATAASALCLFVPIQMASQNWDDHDRSERRVAHDFGRNYLESCEPNAILFTNGDNDTFPLWYAQEVEGFRTDVRVCNTSYLQIDWYINQMKKGAYDSEPLPISWDYKDYVQGKRDFAYVVNRLPNASLKAALNFIKSDDPETKQLFNDYVEYIPSKTLTYKIDKERVLQNGIVCEEEKEHIADSMVIDLSNKDILGKQELIILDMLASNNWDRPMYYAITVSPDQHVNLQSYFRQTGLAQQIVPINTNEKSLQVDTEKMYDNVMNKFTWGGVDKPGLYLDENIMNLCKNYRISLFTRLATELNKEGKTDKALDVLDKGREVLPTENVPHDYNSLSMAKLYCELGQVEKGEEIYTDIIESSLRSLNWFFRMKPGHFVNVLREVEHHLAVISNSLGVIKDYDPTFTEKYQEDFDNYRMTYFSLTRSPKTATPNEE